MTGARKGLDDPAPRVAVLPDGKIAATTHGRGIEGEPPFIVGVRLTLKETDALLKATR